MRLLPVIMLLAAMAVAATAQRTPFQPPPYLIAHRGEAGELPEETAEAYMRGMAQGAGKVFEFSLLDPFISVNDFHMLTILWPSYPTAFVECDVVRATLVCCCCS